MSQLPDIPRLYTALAEWLACMVYVMALRRRVEGWRLALEAGALLVVLSVFLVATGSLPVVFWLPCMAGAVGIMYGLIVLCGDVGPMDGLYRPSCWRNLPPPWCGSSTAFSCWTAPASGETGCSCCL